jgi:predicted kinase
MKPRLILLVGIPGSGKSTLARILEDRGFLILSSDAIRMELTGSESHMDELDADVFRILHDRVKRSLSEHRDVIVDATNARKDWRRPLLQIAESMGAMKVAIVVDVSLEVALQRNRSRDRVVSDPVMREYAFYLGAEAPSEEEGFASVHRVDGSRSVGQLVTDLFSGSEMAND